MPVIYAPHRPRLDTRMLVFPVVLSLLFFVLFVRLWYIQVVKASDLAEKAEILSKTYSSKLAPRGLIFDRKGRLIAGVQSQLVITAIPDLVRKNPWVLDKVAALLNEAGQESGDRNQQNADAERLMNKVKEGRLKPFVAAPIFAGAPVEVATRIAESSEDLPGIAVESQPTRFYPDSRSFSHLLGYVWVPSQDDVARAKAEDRRLASFVGKGGLESVYERDLMGVAGSEALMVDSKRRPVEVAETNNPVPGTQLILGIDSDLQKEAISALAGRRGAVVALDPSNGEILCLASTPTFDLGLFKNGISQQDYQGLVNNAEHPFIDRAIASAFAPGSTFKVVTTVAAMRAGVFDRNRTFYCGGGYRLGKSYFRCLGHHGNIAWQEALERSCNTYFADLAMRVGKDQLRKTALEMGLYEKAGIDLPGERSGLIPTDDYLKRNKLPYVPGYTVLTGIGQGFVLTTPLQMANIAAMVANEGTIYKAHLVHAMKRSFTSKAMLEVKPQVLEHIELPAQHWQLIKDAMTGVVQHGTAAGSQIPGLVWAGKTGSAEVAGQAKTNSWFIGFAPSDHPRIAICVMVEAVGHGADFAAPVAKRVVQRYLMPPALAPTP